MGFDVAGFVHLRIYAKFDANGLQKTIQDAGLVRHRVLSIELEGEGPLHFQGQHWY